MSAVLHQTVRENRSSAYRKAAARMLSGIPEAVITDWGNVTPVEDGAFVEVSIFVPADRLTEKKVS